jgi:hypothetical protein
MRRVMLGVVLVVAVNASAAIEYEFRQISHSDLENVQPTDFNGRALIDGDRSRVEFLNGTGYKPGTYVISTNGSRTMTFVDPAKKAYLDVNAGTVATTLGAAKFSISNKKVDLTQMEDHPIIAGLPTDHYRLSLSYDITLTISGLTLTQAVSALEDKYVTNAFGEVSSTYLAGGALKTGNQDLDDLIDIENTKVKGFALKQVTSTTTTNNSKAVPGSKLQVSRTNTTTREITVTSIQPKPSVNMAVFMVPNGFHKADVAKDDTAKAPFHQLSLEPAPQPPTK